MITLSRALSHPCCRLLWGAVLIVALSGCSIFGSTGHSWDASGLRAGRSITVTGNDNIYRIAQKNNVSMRDLIAINRLKPPFELRPGQRLVLPLGGASFAGEVRAPDAAPLARVEKTRLAPIAPSSVSAKPLDTPTPVRKPLGSLDRATGTPAPVTTLAVPEPVPAVKPTPAVSTPVAFRWPINGPILSKFGAKAAGMNNDGVNIGAPGGTSISASAPGTVAYVGNDMKGFGNLVLIRHEGNMVTAYAHLARVFVKKDSIVAQGDMIGTVGKTGNVASPQLHFEIRKGGKPLDPLTLIKSAS